MFLRIGIKMILIGRICNLLFKLNVGLIAVWMVTLIVGKLLGLEFTKTKYEDIYNVIGVFGISLLAFTYALRNVNTIPNWYFLLAKMFIGLFAFAICFYLFAMASLFTGMCNWTTDSVLFVNKNNHAIKIVVRSYGCGATDSTPATRKTFKIQQFGFLLFTAQEIDVSKLNREEWTSIHPR